MNGGTLHVTPLLINYGWAALGREGEEGGQGFRCMQKDLIICITSVPLANKDLFTISSHLIK